MAISAAIAVAAGIAASQAQMTPNNKLRMAEAAIAQLYVDTVNEDRLVEDAIKACWKDRPSFVLHHAGGDERA